MPGRRSLLNVAESSAECKPLALRNENELSLLAVSTSRLEMTLFFGTCCLTTVVAIVSVFSASHASLQKRMLPWVGGLLLGIGAFWILPELAAQRGWVSSLSSVLAVLLALALINRYIYPICPFCAARIHLEAAKDSTDSCRHTISIGWPLLVVGCIHSFCDGWTIAFSQVAPPSNAFAALSWGVVVHKLPESIAIGILASRLTSSRTLALATVALLQAAMAAGGTLAILSGSLDMRHADIYTIPACAVLLLFGFLSLEEEWRFHGRAAAIRTAAPGLVGCGLVALVSQLLSR